MGDLCSKQLDNNVGSRSHLSLRRRLTWGGREELVLSRCLLSWPQVTHSCFEDEHEERGGYWSRFYCGDLGRLGCPSNVLDEETDDERPSTKCTRKNLCLSELRRFGVGSHKHAAESLGVHRS